MELWHKPKKSAEHISINNVISIYFSIFGTSAAIGTKLLEMKEMNERDFGLVFFFSNLIPQ